MPIAAASAKAKGAFRNVLTRRTLLSRPAVRPIYARRFRSLGMLDFICFPEELPHLGAMNRVPILNSAMYGERPSPVYLLLCLLLRMGDHIRPRRERAGEQGDSTFAFSWAV